MNTSLALKVLFAMSLVSASAGHAAFGADDKASVESFFTDPAMQFVTLSPKGHYVAIVTNRSDRKQLLAILDTSDLKKVTVAAVGSEDTKIGAVHWINENRIGFTVKDMHREFENNWDEFAADRDGANLRHLISGNWLHYQENTDSLIKDKVLTADYGFFGVMHDGSDDIIVAKYTWNNIDRYPDHSRLYRLNTKTKQLTDLLEGSFQPDHAQNWITDLNDVPRIVRSEMKGRCIASYRAPGAASWAEMANFDCYQDNKFTPRFFGGADTLYVSAAYQGHNALYRYDLKKMQMDTEPFVSIPGFDFSGGGEFDLVSKKLLGIRLNADAKATVWLDERFKEIQKKINAILPQTNNLIECPADCAGSPVVVVKSSSDRQPAEYFMYTPASGAMVKLGGAYPNIKPAQMGLRDFYHYSARDGMSIPVYVTMPPGKASGPLPAVVLVHGGPGVRGSSWEWEAEAQFLASRGYVVIQPEFRGSTGFGFAHFKAGWKQWGRDMQDDLADAATWAIKKGWADPKRIAIMGASYGGYATLMGLIKNPDIFRCGVEWAGVTDIKLMFNTPHSDASQDDLQYDMKTLIGDPDKDAAMLEESSPLARAAELKQPLLIAHGGLDVRVPIVHATKFRDAVSKTNPRVEWIVYPEEPHGWIHEETSIAFWKRVETFLDKNLKAPD
ncbi:MAG TPA: alpha/beta fold hydrolase [Telluria sp.]|nr:alpha/beta fold hydrolase [Telluria sp.]